MPKLAKNTHTHSRVSTCAQKRVLACPLKRQTLGKQTLSVLETMSPFPPYFTTHHKGPSLLAQRERRKVRKQSYRDVLHSPLLFRDRKRANTLWLWCPLIPAPKSLTSCIKRNQCKTYKAEKWLYLQSGSELGREQLSACLCLLHSSVY